MNETTDRDPLRVEATADKRLFVSMLTKDIELIPALIDLVDNSVDGARATSPDDLARHEIDITVSAQRFEIADNCGGIALEVARQYAFRFGRPKGHAGTEHSVGQFGVGMKRALFKLGTHFAVESRSAHTSFEMAVDVTQWVEDEDPDWQFRLTSANDQYDPEVAGTGTTIEVDELHESVAEDFGSPTVLGQLREQIRLKHQAVIEQGLRIRLNGEALTGFAPKLMVGPDFAPINRTLAIKVDGGDVFMRLIAGVAESATSDDTLDEGEAEDFRDPGDAGWWVFCNDRLLLFRERSSLTGWGDAAAAYHPQYRRFRGYVYLTAADAGLLPWNTTKTGVDQDSRVWRRVQLEMKIALPQVLSVINRLKSERQGRDELEELPVTDALAGAKATPLGEVPQSATVHVPAPKPKKRSSRPPKPPTTTLHYVVDRNRFSEVASVLDTSVAAEVGRLTFDYFFEREVED